MPDNLRSLFVILSIAVLVFYVFRPAFCPEILDEKEFLVRRNLWLLTTLIAFLSYNFWLFIFLSGYFVIRAIKADPNRVALVSLVLLCVPQIQLRIGGLGLVNFLIAIDYLRLICIVLLVSTYREIVQSPSSPSVLPTMADRLLFCYVALNVVLSFLPGTFTNTLRIGFYSVIDVVVPYLMASRLVKDKKAILAVIGSFVFGALVAAGIGVFESSRQWLLYPSLDAAFGTQWGYGEYLYRGGMLRASGSTGQAIPFGYAMAVGFVLLLSLRRFFKSNFYWAMCLVLMGGGMIASLSRGPWIGSIVGVFVFMLLGLNYKVIIRSFIIVGALLFLLYATPLGKQIEYYLPFSENSLEQESYTYRAMVLKNSLSLISQNPVFGAFDYLNTPEMEELRQGQGIIDIVNTYVSVALNSGLVGLSLFIGFFAVALVAVFRRMRTFSNGDQQMFDLGRGLIAVLTTVLVTIATVSSISIIALVYYMLAGLAIAFARLPNRANGEQLVPNPCPFGLLKLERI